MLHSLISETVKEYLESGERVQLAPPLPHLEDKLDKVWASSLGTCPLRNFKERSKAEPVLPELAVKGLGDLLRMEQGTRYAEVIQEAMVWKFGQLNRLDWLCDPQVMSMKAVGIEIALEDEYVKGRADLIYRTGSDVHVIEIKKPLYLKDDSTPYNTYLYQALAYKFILEGLYPQLNIHAHILIATTTGFNLWSLVLDQVAYVGEIGEERIWGIEDELLRVNGLIGENEWVSELAHQQHYLLDNGHFDPMPDFANDPQSWLCARWQGKARPKQYKGIYKGETERREKMTITCPWFCHAPIESLPGKEFEVQESGYETGRYIPLLAREF